MSAAGPQNLNSGNDAEPGVAARRAALAAGCTSPGSCGRRPGTSAAASSTSRRRRTCCTTRTSWRWCSRVALARRPRRSCSPCDQPVRLPPQPDLGQIAEVPAVGDDAVLAGGSPVRIVDWAEQVTAGSDRAQRRAGRRARQALEVRRVRADQSRRQPDDQDDESRMHAALAMGLTDRPDPDAPARSTVEGIRLDASGPGKIPHGLAVRSVSEGGKAAPTVSICRRLLRAQRERGWR